MRLDIKSSKEENNQNKNILKEQRRRTTNKQSEQTHVSMSDTATQHVDKIPLYKQRNEILCQEQQQ